ncbi:MAG: 1,4-alpha-glucan branching protein GlgB [Verrucomicrobia bacterium]|nr:1,4-alpha-glucan branching protein GlgB [Verrucomicrobiota bacterium]
MKKRSTPPGSPSPATLLSPEDLYPLLECRHSDPHHLLGVRSDGAEGTTLRVFHPGAVAVAVVFDSGEKVPLTKVHADGLFEAEVATALPSAPDAYTVEITYGNGSSVRQRDPYAFAPMLGEVDLYLLGEGRHLEAYRVLGAHPRVIEGVGGTAFAVWAPNAQRVSVVGDFNGWDGRRHMMRRLGGSGIWEIFIPEVSEGDHYKFEIRGREGEVFLKTDPYGFYAQHDLRTACMVTDLERYQWSDSAWMEKRALRDVYAEPMSVYEVHLGSWRRHPEDHNRPLSYLELTRELLAYVTEMGFTHVELLPVMEHPFDGSWGYQVVNFFAPSSRFGSPDEFRHLIDALHQAGIGVILDWVPGHFPKDAHGLARFDGTALYEHEDPRIGEHRDWGTLIFNYGRNEVRNFLIANALFWLDQYHIDGLRVDAVASMLYLDYSRHEGEWVPNKFGGRENLEAIEFLKEFNVACYSRHPGVITIAEESTSWPGVSKPVYDGGLGFGFKWNMGWMNDSLSYIARPPVHRKFHQGEITFSMLYAYHEHFVLVLSHDEVVHGKGSLMNKMPGDDWQKAANLRMFLSWMWAHPGKKLLFQGCEIGQWREWDHDQSIDWHLLEHQPHSGMQRLVKRLNEIYRTEPALFVLDDRPEGFEWIDFHDSENTVWSFLRKAPQSWQSGLAVHGEKHSSDLLVIVNATPVVRHGYRIGVPAAGSYVEILNSDESRFGGSGFASSHRVDAEETGAHGRMQSIVLDLPPLAVLILKVSAQDPEKKL